MRHAFRLIRSKLRRIMHELTSYHLLVLQHQYPRLALLGQNAYLFGT